MSSTKRNNYGLLDWQWVRRLSELTLLNRIVLLLLVAVPLVVALWPKYQASVNRYNRTLDVARQKLKLEPSAPVVAESPATESRLEEPTTDASSPAAEQVPEGTPPQTLPADPPPSNGTETSPATDGNTLQPVADAVANVRVWGIESPLLETRVEANWIDPLPAPRQLPIIPRTWAMAFVAALFILLGDTVRQICCPSIVRDFGQTEYVDSRIQLFARAPSSVTLARASRNLVEHSAAPQADDDKPASSQWPSDFLKASPEMLGEIESSSRATYRSLATKRPLAILISIAAYMIAASIIAKIIQEQTINVLTAAGWI